MDAMREQMAKIRATTDPAERQRLMSAHRAAMREHMKMMRGMMEQGECPMMSNESAPKDGGMMSGGKMKGKMGGMKGEKSQGHQCPMMSHMQMMQGMMEQMMDHLSAQESDAPEVSSQKPNEHVH
jgi:hypothetical protein